MVDYKLTLEKAVLFLFRFLVTKTVIIIIKFSTFIE